MFELVTRNRDPIAGWDDGWGRWFGDLFGGRSLSADVAAPLNIREEKDAYHVEAELPGVKLEDISITLDGNVLTFSGEKKEEKEEKEGGYHRVERRFGSFSRSVELPDYADPEKVTAEYADGVLSIRIGKSEKAAPKKIEVRKK